MAELRAHHVGITVSDLENAVEFYQETLDLTLLDRFTVSGENFSTAVGVDGATGQFAHLEADGVRVELIEYEPEGASRGEASINRPGTAHLGLTVEDIDSFYESLPNSVESVSRPQTTDTGSRILFVRDPEGNLIELLEK
ncbi:lactoylglutathione lyase-like lyase [Halogeometricum borinquense DSM 11551]|uniref:Lactoylglutathione lyase-like lyase n=2 Tax=Halogeometricum borinquense TaxID=60847 RepID=E4NUX8_HALBP|nr:VOC family protein [Halogeometricum borinquense]ADQ68967.1 lactoylglutathione lyase-like lyase [Halogeometricum borinquense DSM 11551]ELY29109.1 lactoylglutathione lyase-like lyase [Halogeometricum borinquense DSM 11551]RYJ08156.1 VOC family protein [Halogeometricum borinquense]